MDTNDVGVGPIASVDPGDGWTCKSVYGALFLLCVAGCARQYVLVQRTFFSLKYQCDHVYSFILTFWGPSFPSHACFFLESFGGRLCFESGISPQQPRYSFWIPQMNGKLAIVAG